MKLIEITGIPGSGKSTISPVIRRYLTSMGLDVFDSKNIIQSSKGLAFSKWHVEKVVASLPKKVRSKVLKGLAGHRNLKQQYALKYAADNPELYNYVLNLTDARPISEDHKRLTLGFFLDSAVCYQIACESLDRDAVLLLDEGFVHRVVTLFVSVEESTIDQKQIRRYLGKIPIVHTLVKIEADVSVCRERMNCRKLPRRLAGSTDNEVEEYLLRSKTAIDCAESFLAQKGTNIVRVGNSNENFSEDSIRSQLSNLDNIMSSTRRRNETHADSTGSRVQDVMK